MRYFNLHKYQFCKLKHQNDVKLSDILAENKYFY